MKLLLTNDDGIFAPGLTALENACSKMSECVVLAPDQAHSGCSHRTTTDRPLAVQEHGVQRFSSDGTPADCVRLGVQHFVNDVDWIVAGINDGANLGVDIFMSGTVAAAREAALSQKKAIAISQYRASRQPADWGRSERLAGDVLRHVMQLPYRKPGYWNINLPDRVTSVDSPQFIMCRPDPAPLPVKYRRVGNQFTYERSAYHQRPRSSQSDIDVCFSGHIAISFVPLDSIA